MYREYTKIKLKDHIIMDTFDVEVKNSAKAQANAEVNQTNNQNATEELGAEININATKSYLSVISTKKDLLSSEHLTTFNQLNTNLSTLACDPEKLAKLSVNENSQSMANYRKLTLQVINRDPNLQEQVAQEQNVQEQMPMMKPDNHMALAIFTTICCCLPLGIVAIVKANSVNSLYMMKQYQAAVMASNEAKKWSMIGIVISLVVWVIYIVFFGGLAALAGFASLS